MAFQNSLHLTSLIKTVLELPNLYKNGTRQGKGLSADFYPNSIILIFDRFGKVLAKVDPTAEGWSGNYNGQLLPSKDYWFSVQLTDKNGVQRNRKGHFSLIRK